MNRGLSQYGGVAAVMVYAVGSLIVGFSLPPEQHERALELRWMGVTLTVLGLTILAVMVTQSANVRALWVALAAAIYCGLLVYCAISNETSGTAHYHHNYLAKHDVVEPVTRADAPEKFRTATNFLWGAAGLFLGVSVVSVVLYRKLED